MLSPEPFHPTRAATSLQPEGDDERLRVRVYRLRADPAISALREAVTAAACPLGSLTNRKTLSPRRCLSSNGKVLGVRAKRRGGRILSVPTPPGSWLFLHHLLELFFDARQGGLDLTHGEGP
jgi:hypothetical protein